MIATKMVKIIGVAAAVAGSLGGCRCGRDVKVDEGVQIDRPAITEEEPGADPPKTTFPQRWRQDDATVNRFVQDALRICAHGNYDAFRELFGTDYSPPGERDFTRVWHNVREIRVASLRRDPRREGPGEYYLHFVVRLRQPDRKSRERRDVVVRLFQEAGRWRMGQAPREVVDKVLAASTRPARSRPAGDDSPQTASTVPK